MLCSSCGDPIKPIVAVDVDGTLGDYHGHFLNFAAGWLDQGLDPLLKGSLNRYNGLYPFSMYCKELFNIDLKTYRDIKLAYRQGGMKRTMPIFPAAKPLVDAVNAEGAELWLTTTRPYLSLDNVVPDTMAWCARHQIDYFGMLFDDDKYKTLAERVDPKRVVAIFDDLPEMYDAARERFFSHVPILVEGRYNFGVKCALSAPLELCVDLARKRIRSWRVEYAT